MIDPAAPKNAIWRVCRHRPPSPRADGVSGRRVAQRPLQLDLPGRAPQQIRAADHIGNVLLGIIHRHRELIGVDPVPGGGSPHRPRSARCSQRSPCRRSSNVSHSPLVLKRVAVGPLRRGARAAGARIARVTLGAERLAGAAAFKGPAVGAQLLKRRLVPPPDGLTGSSRPRPRTDAGPRGVRRICAALSGTTRAVSRSSIRTSQRPPWWRASRKLPTAASTEPRCSRPVGEGAKRPV